MPNPPPPGTPTSRTVGSLKRRIASLVTSVMGSSRTPNVASSSSGVAGSPTRISSAMPSWSSGAKPSRRGSPSGPVTRSCTSSRKSLPVTALMISASTQCADVGWYSYRVPGSQLSRQFAMATSRDSDVSHCGGFSGACGKPDVCSITCSTVIWSLPFSPNAGT